MCEKLLDKTEVINELATSLCKAQADMKAAEMNSVNPFLKNKYADLGSVIEAARPVLAKNGLSFSQLVSGTDGSVTVTTMLLHGSGQWISSAISLPIGEEKGKSMAQVAGSIITYLRRYALSSILGIYADEDVDGNAPQRPAQTQRPQQQAQAQRPAAPAQRPQAPAQTAQPPAPKPPAQTATQPTNGNGNAPITGELWGAVDIAGKLTTSKGTPLSDLNRDQLQIVQDKSKDGGLKTSATTLLAEPDDRHWTEFYALVGKADIAGLMPAEPPENVCVGELRKLMHDIVAQLQAIQTPA